MSNRNGTRTIELFNPVNGMDRITFKPVTLDLSLRWQAGEMGGPLALMAELTDMQEAILGMLTYPDADRVMSEFMYHLPDVMRQSVAQAPARPIRAEPAPQPGDAPEPHPFPGGDGDADDGELGVNLDGRN